MRPILYLVLCLAVTWLAPLTMAAQDCPKVKISDFPQKDLPANFNPSQIKDNPSYKYYYGLGVPINYTKARQLAFIEMKENADNDGPFEGSSILLMLYANGYGVKRNLDLSIRLACANVGGASKEVEFRVDHLKELKSNPSKKPFDICDDITSGYMMGFCSSLESEREEIARNLKLKRIIKTWPQKDSIAYIELRKVADDLFDEICLSEVDLSGTARGAMSNGENEMLEDSFLNHIITVNKCSIKEYSEEDFAKSDKQLNTIYSKIMKAKEYNNGTVTKESIKTTQRKWINIETYG